MTEYKGDTKNRDNPLWKLLYLVPLTLIFFPIAIPMWIKWYRDYKEYMAAQPSWQDTLYHHHEEGSQNFNDNSLLWNDWHYHYHHYTNSTEDDNYTESTWDDWYNNSLKSDDLSRWWDDWHTGWDDTRRLFDDWTTGWDDDWNNHDT